MIFDADILGYFMNGGDNKEAGHLGFHAFAANPEAKAPTPNVWIWSLGMNNFGKQKDAAWYFMQWASGLEHDLFGARKMDFVNPVRHSVWKDEDVPRPDRQELSGLSRAVRGVGAGLEDLLHAAAAVLQPDHRLGGSAAEDGGERGAGRRGPRPAGRERQPPAEAGRARLRRKAAAWRGPPSRRPPASGNDRGTTSMATAAASAGTPRRRPLGQVVLPYLLSLPALLVCVGILIPFVTAV